MKSITLYNDKTKYYLILFSHEILQITNEIGSIGGIVWPLLLADAFVWVVVYICIMKGAKSVCVYKYTLSLNIKFI